MGKIQKLFRYIECTLWVQVFLVSMLILLALLEIQAISEEIKKLSTIEQQYVSGELQNKILTRTPVTPADIEGWMTFAYINTVFKLPTDYLKNSLGIIDERYPNISVSRYVRSHIISNIPFLVQLKDAVSNYNR